MRRWTLERNIRFPRGSVQLVLSLMAAPRLIKRQTLDYMMKITRKNIMLASLLVVLVIGLGIAFVTYSIYLDLNPPEHRYTIDPGTYLTQDLAIEYTHRALHDDGKAVPGMRPRQFWPDSQFKDYETERIFARNTLDPYGGYVAWSIGYHVTIEKKGNEVICQVYRPK